MAGVSNPQVLSVFSAAVPTATDLEQPGQFALSVGNVRRPVDQAGDDTAQSQKRLVDVAGLAGSLVLGGEIDISTCVIVAKSFLAFLFFQILTFAPLLPMFSLPARSTRFNLPILSSSSPGDKIASEPGQSGFDNQDLTSITSPLT